MSIPATRKKLGIAPDINRIFHEGKLYFKSDSTKTTRFYRCGQSKRSNCSGRAKQLIATGEFCLTQEHTCREVYSQEEIELDKRKETAFLKLRELTLKSGPGETSAEIVRKFLEQLDPSTVELMPDNTKLGRKVREFAKRSGKEIARIKINQFHNVEEGFLEDVITGGSAIVIVKKEPGDQNDPLAPDESKEAIEIRGETFVWKMDLTKGRGSVFKCRESRLGCKCTVRIYLEKGEQKRRYELRGQHVHERGPLNKSSDCFTLRQKSGKVLNQEEGSLENIHLGGFVEESQLESATTGMSESFGDTNFTAGDGVRADDVLQEGFHDDNFDEYNDGGGGEEVQMNFDPEPYPDEVHKHARSKRKRRESATFKEVFVSSNPKIVTRQGAKQKGIAKSGEKCFVCGDDLILSETESTASSTNREIFRKACCYLNVKFEKEWLPKTSSFFCDTCTNEISRIQQLYQRVGEFQSLIFKMVEQVEKRIADAIILDNWEDEKPPVSAIRLAGFRKQVLINYRNKLKLRREIRVGKKLGHEVTEIRPNTTAHMYASDPSQTTAFSRMASSSSVRNLNESGTGSSAKKSKRGRPARGQKSSQSLNFSTALDKSSDFDGVGKDCGSDGDWGNDFQTFDDNASVASERETKFDPSQLDAEGEKDSADVGMPVPDFDLEQSDEDYEEDDDDDDEDWNRKRTRQSKTAKSRPKANLIQQNINRTGRGPWRHTVSKIREVDNGSTETRLLYEGKLLLRHGHTKTHIIYRCNQFRPQKCLGKMKRCLATGELTQMEEHICDAQFSLEELEDRKKKEELLSKLEELTLSTEEKVIDTAKVVEKFLSILDPDIRETLPWPKLILRRKVRYYARKGGKIISKPASQKGEVPIHKLPAEKAKKSRKDKSYDGPFELPDAILSKDGKLTIAGIEITKNPPGVYERHPRSPSFACGICGKMNISLRSMKQHICAFHLGTFKCSFCDKLLCDAKTLRRHEKFKHTEGVESTKPCPICGKPSSTYGMILNRHMWTHLSEEEKKDPQYEKYRPTRDKRKDPGKYEPSLKGLQTFMCSYCPKTFIRIGPFREHEKSHLQEKPSFQCQYCGKIFKSKKTYLYEHTPRCERKVKGLINLHQFPCPKCPLRLSTRGGRVKHIKLMHSDTRVLLYSCPKCPRRFRSRNGMLTHKRMCVAGGTTDDKKGIVPTTETPGGLTVTPSLFGGLNYNAQSYYDNPSGAGGGTSAGHLYQSSYHH